MPSQFWQYNHLPKGNSNIRNDDHLNYSTCIWADKINKLFNIDSSPCTRNVVHKLHPNILIGYCFFEYFPFLVFFEQLWITKQSIIYFLNLNIKSTKSSNSKTYALNISKFKLNLIYKAQLKTFFIIILYHFFNKNIVKIVFNILNYQNYLN